MALISPGVEVTIKDQSQYLPAAGPSIPFVLLATAANKKNPNGAGVAPGTLAANAGKLYQVTSQRDLTTLYGNPLFYTSSDGTPIQGDELNEYGLLAAYSVLGATSNAYVLRADIDLASLAPQAGRPTGAPSDGTYWLDTTSSTWGIYEWNKTTQAFKYKKPIVITDSTQLNGNAPKDSIGNIGDYAIVEVTAQSGNPIAAGKTFFYKVIDNFWAVLGSGNWLVNTATVTGSNSNPTLTVGNTITIQITGGASITATATTSSVATLATNINSFGLSEIYAEKDVSTGALVIYSVQLYEKEIADPPHSLTISGTGTILNDLGISPGTYYQPQVVFGTNAQMPLWQTDQVPAGTYNAPSGSVWIKTTSGTTGLTPVVKSYNATTGAWVTRNCSLATSDWVATEALDATGGSLIPAGTVYAQYNYDGGLVNSPLYIWKRVATGPTVITGSVTNPTFTGPFTANVYVSKPGYTTLSDAYVISLGSGTKTAADFVAAWQAASIQYTSAAVNSDGAIVLTHTEGGEIVLDDYVNNVSQGLFATAGFTPVAVGTFGSPGYVPATTGAKYGPSASMSANLSTTNVSGSGTGLQVTINTINGTVSVAGTFPAAGTGYAVGDVVKVLGTSLGGVTPGNDVSIKILAVNGSGGVTSVALMSQAAVSAYTTQLSNWQYVAYLPNEGAPTQEPASYTNWFWSTATQVDIMVNTSSGWMGYKNVAYDSNGFPKISGTNATDANGPICSATEPTTQSDGTTALAYGDLWIDTSAAALESYPKLSRWQQLKDKNGTPTTQNGWVLIDNTDQTSSSGVLFADARWATNDSTNPSNDPIPTIKSLLTSDYLDMDAPSYKLYPVGMLLFNTRRSGYNVKQYRQNYFTARNFPDQPSYPAVTAAWVSASGLQSDGSAYMGRKAQRNMVVKAMRSTLDTNQDIRNEDYYFNLLATPNYPELQPNMVVLNGDRGETGYILGDTPMGLPMQATDITAWANNTANAAATGEAGCVTRNTYMGLFYPSGITSDLSGNLVAIPPSHMMLRTFIRNDTVAYPWFAAAGTQRGKIDNATNIGYLNRFTGEFQPIKTPLGIRNVLYANFINPLVNFTGNGLLNYGNKTSDNSQSALDRTNVARLVAYIRRQLTIAARPFVFEPNDAITRQQIAGVIESLMIDLVAKRGIYDYSVVCDSSNNPPSVIDRNELWVDVAIEPVKAAEFIYIPVRVLNTGELSQ